MTVNAGKLLTWLHAALAIVASLSLTIMLAASPPYQCGDDYESPPTPAHAGGLAILALVVAIVTTLVAIGLRIGVSKQADARVWATRAVSIGLVCVLVAGGATFADLARWTCWP